MADEDIQPSRVCASLGGMAEEEYEVVATSLNGVYVVHHPLWASAPVYRYIVNGEWAPCEEEDT